jgi:hypothetical protein
MQINGFVWDDAVNEQGNDDFEQPRAARRHPLVVVLAAVVFAECALLIAATLFLVVELIVATPSSYPSAVALTVLTTIAAIWLGLIAVNILRGRAWVRGATVVWQVLQIAVAIGSFQGLFARPDIGWALLLPALLALGLVFTKPVIAATGRRDG